MSKKNKGRSDGLVYSTNQDYFNDFEEYQEAAETLPKDKQKLKVKLDSKHRAGKIVTLGDYKEKVVTWLKDWGYVLTK